MKARRAGHEPPRLRGKRKLTDLTLNLGILLALVCAIATQLAFLYKHRGANEAPRVDVRHPLKSGKALFKSKWFALGMAIALGAWIFHVAALALAPMSVVQAVLSTGVVMLAVLADRIFGFKVGLRQWAGVAMTAAGLMPAGRHAARGQRRPLGLLARRDDLLRGRHARDRRAAGLGPAARRSGPSPRDHARRRRRHAVRGLRRRDQGAHRRRRLRRHARSPRGSRSRPPP